jgi:hypothetical protein
VLHFDINSGSLLTKFSSGAAAQTAYGIGMRGPVAPVTPAGPLIASPQNVTVSVGQGASFDIVFVPSGAAVGQNFTFSCANLPVGAQCKFSPQSAIVNSAGITVPVTITSTAGARAQAKSFLQQRVMAWWTLFAGVLFAGDLRLRRRSRNSKWPALLAIALVLFLIACSASSKSSSGGSSSGNNAAPTPSSSTPAGSYTLVLHATAGNNLQSSTLVNLTVQ